MGKRIYLLTKGSNTSESDQRSSVVGPFDIANIQEKMMFWNKKKDHSAAIEQIALSLIENKQETGALPFLSLKEAADYAKDKSPLYAPGFVQCHAIIGRGYYNLEFKPHPSKGVYMSAFYYGDASTIGGMASDLKGSRS